MFLGAVKFHESIFALPFAYVGMVLAAGGWPTWEQFLWITVAMVGARTFGMAANRVIDRHIDARNPRARDRHLPSGKLKTHDLVALALVSAAVFFYAAARLNRLALALAPVAAAYLVFYPYTKRFTWLSNPLLGWALAISPSAAWIGVRGSLSWEPVVLSLAVALWAGSFDIIYHAQDYQFYRRHGLHSVAARFGLERAFQIARAMDALAVVCLVGVGAMMGMGAAYYAGVAAVAALLAYKHRLVSPRDLSRLGMAFFRMNAYVSTTVLVATLVDVFLV